MVLMLHIIHDVNPLLLYSQTSRITTSNIKPYNKELHLSPKSNASTVESNKRATGSRKERGLKANPSWGPQRERDRFHLAVRKVPPPHLVSQDAVTFPLVAFLYIPPTSSSFPHYSKHHCFISSSLSYLKPKGYPIFS